MKILHFPNPSLFNVAIEVTEFNAELKIQLDSMYEAMKKNKGIGLAANQVGLTQNMFVMDGPNGRINLVNPKIVWKSLGKVNIKEGCLSAPGDFVVVPSRCNIVQITYRDEAGEPRGTVLSGLFAVCAQHEVDHLLGKTFFADKSIPRNQRNPLMKKWGVK